MSTNKITWIAKGNVFKDGQKPNPAVDGNINVKESGKGLSMPHSAGEKTGIPIAAKLAVNYIRQLWEAVDNQGLRTLVDDTQATLDNVRLSFTNIEMPEKEKQLLIDAYNKVTENMTKAHSWLVQLLDSSAAITMNKNILLKTLSQDECEGVRFYLCMKNRPLGEKEKIEDGFVDKLSGGPLPTVLTLSTVGVDKHGKDLFYDYPLGRAQSTVGSAIPDIEDESLAGEYPLVSGQLCTKPFADTDLAPYTLYKFAKTTK